MSTFTLTCFWCEPINVLEGVPCCADGGVVCFNTKTPVNGCSHPDIQVADPVHTRVCCEPRCTLVDQNITICQQCSKHFHTSHLSARRSSLHGDAVLCFWCDRKNVSCGQSLPVRVCSEPYCSLLPSDSKLVLCPRCGKYLHLLHWSERHPSERASGFSLACLKCEHATGAAGTSSSVQASGATADNKSSARSTIIHDYVSFFSEASVWCLSAKARNKRVYVATGNVVASMWFVHTLIVAALALRRQSLLVLFVCLPQQLHTVIELFALSAVFVRTDLSVLLFCVILLFASVCVCVVNIKRYS